MGSRGVQMGSRRAKVWFPGRTLFLLFPSSCPPWAPRRPPALRPTQAFCQGFACLGWGSPRHPPLPGSLQHPGGEMPHCKTDSINLPEALAFMLATFVKILFPIATQVL